MRSTVEDDDVVWLKLNCEGSECVVLDHLVAEGELARVAHLLVHFDVEKIPALASHAADTRWLAASGVEWIEADEILGRSHAQKTANWLRWTEASRFGRFRCRHLAQGEFRWRQALYPLSNGSAERRRAVRTSTRFEGGSTDVRHRRVCRTGRPGTSTTSARHST